MVGTRLCTCCLLFVSAFLVQSEADQATEKSLAKHLLKSYEDAGLIGRPILKASDPIKVNITVILNQVINEPDNSITIATYLFMKWQDDFLKWDPAKFGGLNKIVLPIANIWRPDVFIWNDYYNNWADQYAEMDAIDAWVFHDGMVAWNPTGIYRVLCNSDPGYQTAKNCTFTFGSLTHATDEMDIVFDNGLSDFNMTVLMPTPGINIVDHSAAKVLAVFDIPRPNSQYWNMNYFIAVEIKSPSESGAASNATATRKRRSAPPSDRFRRSAK